MYAAISQTPIKVSLDAVPWTDVAGCLQAAMLSGHKLSRILRELVALRRGPGRLSVAEYFYYDLWRSEASRDAKRRFVGKRAQRAMHLACNDYAWNGATEDKLVFQAVAMAAGLPLPPLLAIAHPARSLGAVAAPRTEEALASLLRDPALYPFFAKPIDGIYSLGAISADHVTPLGEVILGDGSQKSVGALAAELLDHAGGMLIQRRLLPAPSMAERFGNRLSSVRLLTLLTEDGPRIVRAICRIPAPGNIADNFWRLGNIVAAVGIDDGVVRRSVRGTAFTMETDPVHASGASTCGFEIPNWRDVQELVCRAAVLFPGVRTQS